MLGNRVVVPFPCLLDRVEGGEIGARGHPWGHPVYGTPQNSAFVRGPNTLHDRPQEGREWLLGRLEVTSAVLRKVKAPRAQRVQEPRVARRAEIRWWGSRLNMR
jgi:hypothetical protein